jgi:hypothetical protein
MMQVPIVTLAHTIPEVKMNIWATFLRASPATLQRLIARHHRISLPRGCSAEERVQRLRAALIHQRTTRVTYFSLDATTQAAVQDLRARRYSIRADELMQRYGPIRPLAQLAADPTPQSLSERLLLLGWLLPRPATRFHPASYIFPRELRQWLPRPLDLPTYGPAVPPPVAPAVRAAAVLLIAASEQPLAVRDDGLLRQSSLRHLLPRLGLPDAPHLPHSDAQRATAERRAQEWERRARQAEAQLAAVQPQLK